MPGQEVQEEKNITNLKTTVRGSNKAKEEEQSHDGEEQEGDEEGSNVSESSANEEQRHLKDFKALISERTVPKSVNILNRTTLLLILILCGISGFDLGMKITNESDAEEGMNAINSGYMLASSLP